MKLAASERPKKPAREGPFANRVSTPSRTECVHYTKPCTNIERANENNTDNVPN